MDDWPAGPGVLLSRGYAYEAAGRHSEAMAYYREALGYEAADHEALLDGLARCESALEAGEDSHK